MLQRVILHIGMSKAGSTAIQQTLADNTEVLTKMGICFPEVGRWGNAHFKIRFDIRNRRSLEHLKLALDEAAYSNTAVISCEGFWLMTEREIELLNEGLRAYDTTAILYLRNPADYLCSAYRQGIKSGRRTHTCAAFLTVVQTEDRMNYPKLLNRWARYFPLRVRTYEAVKHAIEDDFLNALNVPTEQANIHRRIVNATPSDGATYFMMLANRYLPARVSKLVRRRVTQSGRRFDFWPPIDDESLRQYGKEVIRQWDLDVMREYLSKEDMDFLLA